MNKKTILLLIITALFLLSCTTSSGKNRGSLSDAMDKSRNENEEDREVPDDDDPWEYEEPEEDEEDDPYEPEDPPVDLSGLMTSDGDFSMIVMLRGGSGFTGGPYFTNQWTGEILIGDSFGNWEVYLYGGTNSLITNPSHSVSESIKEDVFSFHGGIEGRYYFFKDLKFFSPYVLGQMGGFLLAWEFQNPLIAGSDTISSDSLGGFLLGCGLGVDFFRGEYVKIGCSVIPEALLFGDETSQGFSNDYFETQGMVRWALEAGLRF